MQKHLRAIIALWVSTPCRDVAAEAPLFIASNPHNPSIRFPARKSLGCKKKKFKKASALFLDVPDKKDPH